MNILIYNPVAKTLENSFGKQVRVFLPGCPEPAWREELSLEVLW